MVQLQLMENLSFALKTNDTNALLAALDIVYILLDAGNRIDNNEMNGKVQSAYSKKMQRLGIIQRLEKLQTHMSDSVYNKSIEILEEFFEIENSTYI